MDKIRLGRTGLNVARCGFGALPIQRIGREEAGHILRKAFDNGINFFDTARMYSDSENKIGHALADVREDILIATKTAASDRKALFGQLESSLQSLKTDYIDVYQLHNPESLPNPEEPEGLYQALLEAKNKGMIRFIGISSHRLTVALEAAASKLYDTVQFPLSSISSDEDIKLIDICKRNDVGLIAMKALAGGLIGLLDIGYGLGLGHLQEYPFSWHARANSWQRLKKTVTNFRCAGNEKMGCGKRNSE